MPRSTMSSSASAAALVTLNASAIATARIVPSGNCCWRIVADRTARRHPWAARGRQPAKAIAGRVARAAIVLLDALVCQRVGPDLDVHGTRLGTLAAFLQPRRAVAVGAPQAAPFPACVRIVDARIQPLGEEAERVRNAQHHHLPILEGDEAIVEVGGRDRDILAQPDRVVLVHPGVVARLRGAVLEAFERRTRILVLREAFWAMVARRGRTIERPFALAAIEPPRGAVRPRPPIAAVLVDAAAAKADHVLRH